MALKSQILDDRALLVLTGGDVHEFLQTIVTNDVDALGRNLAVYAALLTPQGKYLFDFLLVPDEDRVLVDCLKTARAGLIRRLTMYKLRADVQITDAGDEMTVAACWGGGLPFIAGVVQFADPRLADLGLRIYGPMAVIDAALSGTTPGDWNAHRLSLGVPVSGADLVSEGCFWLETNAAELNGVDFRKGCYVGQEVVSRMHHKTELRKRFVRVKVDGAAEAGAEIMAGERVAGTLTSVNGDAGIAFLRLDRARGQRLTAGTAALTLDLPAWLPL